MKDFDVYFEIYGKKLKATVMAADEIAAQSVIKSKIKFYKIVPAQNVFNTSTNVIDDILNLLKKKS